MTLVGTKDLTLINRDNIENENYNDVDIMIDVIDGYLCKIFIKDTKFLKQLKEPIAR